MWQEVAPMHKMSTGVHGLWRSWPYRQTAWLLRVPRPLNSSPKEVRDLSGCPEELQGWIGQVPQHSARLPFCTRPSAAPPTHYQIKWLYRAAGPGWPALARHQECEAEPTHCLHTSKRHQDRFPRWLPVPIHFPLPPPTHVPQAWVLPWVTLAWVTGALARDGGQQRSGLRRSATAKGLKL